MSVGKGVHVPCKATGSPEAQIRWTKMDESNSQVGRELKFDSVTLKDAGVYECRASNGVEKDLIARVSLKVMGKYW